MYDSVWLGGLAGFLIGWPAGRFLGGIAGLVIGVIWGKVFWARVNSILDDRNFALAYIRKCFGILLSDSPDPSRVSFWERISKRDERGLGEYVGLFTGIRVCWPFMLL